MKTIQIDDDLYSYLLRNSREIGEDASSIIRRLLKLPKNDERNASILSAPTKIDPAISTSNSSIDECLSDPRFRAERDAVGRFLFILSWLAKRHSKAFSGVLNLQGRVRKYFGTSADSLEESGSSVFPQKIPDTHYWVITNNDTPKKQRMLQDVMHLLGYPKNDGYRASDALE